MNKKKKHRKDQHRPRRLYTAPRIIEEEAFERHVLLTCLFDALNPDCEGFVSS